MTPDETMQAENQTVETPSAPETSQQEQAVSTEAEQLFEAFQTAEINTSADIAKQQDIIDTLNAKIKDLQAKQVRKNQDAVVFEQVAKSNAFPHLSSFFLSKAENAKKSAVQQNDKIKKLKKKIKKAEKKIKRLKRKLQKNELFKGFFSSLFDKNTDRSAYVTGMQALREDSLMRAEKKLDKVEQKLETARAKLADGKLSHTEAVKLNARIKKLEGQKEILEAKINNLTELEQSLNKLAKMEVVDAQLEEIKEVTLQNAAGKGIISQAVDGMTSPEVTSTIQKAVTGEVKEEAETVSPVSEDEAAPTKEKPVVPEQPPVAEKQDNAQQAETPAADKKPVAAGKADFRKREHLTDKEFQAVIDAGLPVRAKKVAANDITVIFDVSQTAQLDQAIASARSQMSSVKR